MMSSKKSDASAAFSWPDKYRDVVLVENHFTFFSGQKANVTTTGSFLACSSAMTYITSLSFKKVKIFPPA